MKATTAAIGQADALTESPRLEPSPHRRVLTLALPAVGEQLLNMTVGLVDTFLVGHLGAASLTAVGLSNQLIMLVTTLLASLAVGSTALVARAVGSDDMKLANRTVNQSVLAGSFIGIAGTLIFFFGAETSARLMGAEGEALLLAATYTRIVALSLFFSTMMFIGNACLRGAGDTRSPMAVMMVVNVVNIAVAASLVYGFFGLPKLGVAGSATGAALGRGLGGVVILWFLFRGRVGLRLRTVIRPDLDIIGRILKVGLPAGAESLLLRGGLIIYARLVAVLGTAAFAAHTVALNAESLSFLPGFGFAVAATTLVGQNLGAKNPHQAERDARIAYYWGAGLMALMGAVFFVGARPLMMLFTDEPDVIALGTGPLRLIGLAQPLLAAVMIFSGALRGAGDTRWPMLINGFSVWVVRVSLTALLAIVLDLGLLGAWIAMACDLTMRGTLVYLRFRHGGWKQARV